MKITVSSENTNKVIVSEYNTRYNVGDYVIVRSGFYYPGDKPIPYQSKFYTNELDSEGFNKTTVCDVPWNITDIQMSLATGQVLYMLRYSWRRCIFPAGCRGAREDEIIRKLTKEELDELRPKID